MTLALKHGTTQIIKNTEEAFPDGVSPPQGKMASGYGISAYFRATLEFT